MIILLVLLFFIAETQQENIMKNITISVFKEEFYKNLRHYDTMLNENMKMMEIIKCNEMEHINLSKMYLRSLNNDLIRSKYIRQISLQENFLENVPNIFTDTSQLRCLNMSKNKINIYEDNYMKHQNLEILDFSYQNPIQNSEVTSELEVEIHTEDMKYKFMIFNNNGIYLPNLQHLILSGNAISSLSSNFNNSFPSLKYLYLINISALTINPNFFDDIPMSVRVLHLENNNLSNLTLHNMPEITELYLDNNPLKIINIISKKLQVLSLTNCNELEKGIFQTPRLEYLDLSRNNLNSVSETQFEMYKSLHTLLLDHNKLLYIPILKGLRLTRLSLNYNMIIYISSNSFVEQISLKNLSLRGNRIERIESDSFSSLKNLEYLDISENRLMNLPYDWLSLINLRYLDLSSNQFKTILDMSINPLNFLKHLIVANNTFKETTTVELNSLPNFSTVYL